MWLSSLISSTRESSGAAGRSVLARFDSEIDVYIALPDATTLARTGMFIKPFNDGCVKAVNFADKTGAKQVLALRIDFTRRAVLAQSRHYAHYHDTIGLVTLLPDRGDKQT